MPMDGNARGDADYAAIAAANPNMDKLSGAETDRMKQFFEILFSADTSYIQANADVIPAAHGGEDLSAPSGQPVSITTGPGAGSTGSVIADTPLAGKGSIA